MRSPLLPRNLTWGGVDDPLGTLLRELLVARMEMDPVPFWMRQVDGDEESDK